MSRATAARRWTVGPDGGRGVEHVGHGEDPSGERDRVAGQPVGVARAVRSARGGGGRRAWPRRGESISRRTSQPTSEWRSISVRSSGVSGSRLPEDRVRHRDLADVVQQEAELDLGSSQNGASRTRAISMPVGGDALGVLARVGVARLDGVAQRPHRGHVGPAQLMAALALALERLAQIRGIALELLFLLGCRTARRWPSAPAAPRRR